jgi:hypothetical protein
VKQEGKLVTPKNRFLKSERPIKINTQPIYYYLRLLLNKEKIFLNLIYWE